MENYTTPWTKEELNIYILIYCANANFIESNEEIDFIKMKAKHSSFDKIHKEFEKDNDFQSLQKIQSAIERHGYTSKELETLYAEIKDLYLTDDDYGILEQNLLRGLKHLLG
ncbi:MAG: hypothetical protein R2793_07680 [Flavobacteriaceae bacterium]